VKHTYRGILRKHSDGRSIYAYLDCGMLNGYPLGQIIDTCQIFLWVGGENTEVDATFEDGEISLKRVNRPHPHQVVEEK
jgi:hypothetical protein